MYIIDCSKKKRRNILKMGITRLKYFRECRTSGYNSSCIEQQLAYFKCNSKYSITFLESKENSRYNWSDRSQQFFK